MLRRLCTKNRGETMKKYKVLISGTNYVTAESEDKAIEHTQEKIDMIHKSLNMSVFAIAEVVEAEY